MASLPMAWRQRALIVAVLAAYLPFFKTLAHVSATEFYARHVIFVPILAGGLLWLERNRLRDVATRSAVAGPVVTGLALTLLALAYRAGSLPLQAMSFVAAAAGLVLWSRGPRGVRTVRFVLALLLFMVPPPRAVIAAIAPGIQHFAAGFSRVVLDALQIPVEQEGILLQLPGVTLEVAEGCAGLRFTLILLVLVAAFARVVVPTSSGQLGLIALSIPVAMLANALRVAAISVGAHAIGPHIATGPLHDHIGKAFWTLALLAMMAIASVLRSRIEGIPISEAVSWSVRGGSATGAAETRRA